MSQEDFKRKLTAILSADVVGYSRLMGDDEAATVKTLETYKGVMFSLIKQHRGRVIDSPGDNLLAEFGSVVDAVQCAVSIQKELQTRNAELSENRRMDFRIGINLGDVIEEQDRIYGDGVNIAARLEALADPGGICISKTAFDYIENKLPFGYRFIGEQAVKNIAKPVGAYKVLMETRLIDEEAKKVKTPIWRRNAISIGIILILGLASFLYWNFYSQEPSIEPASIETKPESSTPDVKEALKSIAVLPFDDISPEKDQEYFVDGLSEEILNSLTQIPNLRVIAKTSSFSFKGQNKTVQEIAKILGVDHVLEGSVRKSGNTIRITAQLIRTDDESHLWSETYDKELGVKELFDIQEDIANSVAGKLKLTLEAFRLVGGTDNIKAYEYFLIAQGLIGKGSSSDFKYTTLEQEAIDTAISIDPKFARAWVHKARIHSYWGLVKPVNLAVAERDIALKAASKAIELEPNLAAGYVYLGTLKTSSGDFIGGEIAIREALNLINKSYWESARIAGHYSVVGLKEKAHKIIVASRQNESLNFDNRVGYIASLASLGYLKQAEEEYIRIKSLVGYNQWDDMTITILRIGTKDKLSKEDIIFSDPVNDAAKENLESPEKGILELRRLYMDDNINFGGLTNISIWAAYFGDPDFSISVMDKAVKVNASGFSMAWWPVMKDVRQLPHFKELVKKIGLVDYWKQYGWPDNNLCHPVGDDDFVCN